MRSVDKGKHLGESIFANEADPAFRRRAAWIGSCLWRKFEGQPFTLLDVGCGRGFYFPLYASLGARIVAIENDPLPFVVAKAVGEKFNVQVVDACAENLPFATGEFDAVVMSEVLEHLESPVKALLEVNRVLADSGILVVTVPNIDYPFFWDPINWLLERLFRRPIRSGPLAGIWANHLRLYSVEALAGDLKEAGFRIKEVYCHTCKCMPFLHNIVYGLGKSLLERNALPARWAEIARRGGGAKALLDSRNPVALGIKLIQWFDRKNADEAPPLTPCVNLCVSATK